jgi:hypothetical protein
LIVSVDALKLVPLIFEDIKSSINNNLNWGKNIGKNIRYKHSKR